MEASLMGVPSVVTDIRGCREVVKDGVNGRIVPLGNVEALANAILDLLHNPGESKELWERQLGRIGPNLLRPADCFSEDRERIRDTSTK